VGKKDSVCNFVAGPINIFPLAVYSRCSYVHRNCGMKIIAFSIRMQRLIDINDNAAYPMYQYPLTELKFLINKSIRQSRELPNPPIESRIRC